MDYREQFSAAGNFPGGEAKWEEKPSEKDDLTSCLFDRPLSPLLSKGFINEIQVIGLLLAAKEPNEGNILIVNGAWKHWLALTFLGLDLSIVYA
jgi:polyribonucleotide nucleotidyltransferase